MKSKLNHLFSNKWLWTLSIITIFSLFASQANAQLSEATDSALLRNKIKHFTRAGFATLSAADQVNLLSHPPFVVDDLKNATYQDFLNQSALSSSIFLSTIDFYSSTDVTYQRQVLLRPEIYKVYLPAH